MLERLIAAAEAAGRVIEEIRKTGFAVEMKGSQGEVTEADGGLVRKHLYSELGQLDHKVRESTVARKWHETDHLTGWWLKRDVLRRNRERCCKSFCSPASFVEV